MSKSWQARVGGLLCCLAVAAGCGDSGSESPGPGGDGAGNDGDLGGDGASDGNGGDGNGADGAGSDGDSDGSNADGSPAASELTGDYWMRTDIVANVTQDLGIGSAAVTVRSEITAYSLVRVTEQGGTLTMTDFQCHVTTEQSCPDGACTRASSVALEGETEAYAPSKRTLSLNGSNWSTDRCAAAVGWEWDCTSGAPDDLPTDASDERVYNPAGGGPGVDIEVSAALGFITGMCTANVVQKVDVVYSGSFSGGKFDTGVATDMGSDQNALMHNCSDGELPDPVPTGPGTLRIVDAPSPIAGGDGAWECPTLDQFEQALPNP